jgi:plasmid stabilization system protein ParE
VGGGQVAIDEETMSMPIVLRPEVEQDLRSARDWYDVRRDGLGDEFSMQVSQMFDTIGKMPEMFAVAWKDIRKCRLARFPYNVYYRTLADRVEVLAVIHASRHPSSWKARY